VNPPVAEPQRARIGRAVAALIAALGWLALAIQLHILICSAPTITAAVVKFLGYFTILTNILIAVSMTACARRSGFFARPAVSAALATYIATVLLVYEVLLRSLWQPTGLQFVADILLHDIVPIAYVVWWLAFIPRGQLQWRDVWPWLLYPAGYALYAIVRGELLGDYPYPFIDVIALGALPVALNVALLLVLFAGIGFLFVAVDRVIGRPVPRAAP